EIAIHVNGWSRARLAIQPREFGRTRRIKWTGRRRGPLRFLFLVLSEDGQRESREAKAEDVTKGAHEEERWNVRKAYFASTAPTISKKGSMAWGGCQKAVSGCALEGSAPSLPWWASHSGADGAVPSNRLPRLEAVSSLI